MTEIRLTGVSVGSGDPQLITLAALDALRAAHVIFALQATSNDAAIALDTARPHLRDDQTVVMIPVERGSRAGERDAFWRQTADQIVAALSGHAHEQALATVRGTVVQLGDASLYGTFAYIKRQLNSHHPQVICDVQAGVTSFATAAARLGLSLVAIDERLCVLPATYCDDDTIQQALDHHQTIVLLKAGFVREHLFDLLEGRGLLDKTHYVEHLGLPDERIISDPQDFPRTGKGPYLTLMIVRP